MNYRIVYRYERYHVQYQVLGIWAARFDGTYKTLPEAIAHVEHLQAIEADKGEVVWPPK